MRLTFFIAIAVLAVSLGQYAANSPDRSPMALQHLAAPGQNLDEVRDAFRALGFQAHDGRYFASAEYVWASPGSFPMSAVDRHVERRAFESCPWDCQILVVRETEHVTWLGTRFVHRYQYVIVAVDGVLINTFENHTNWAWSF